MPRRRAYAGVGGGVVAGLVLVVALLAATPGPAGAAGATGATSVAGSDPGGGARRVLVFTLPNVSWSDLDHAVVPNLERFIARAGVAGLSTRADALSTPLADGYATIGAGTRSVGDPATNGDGLGVAERFGVTTAGEAYSQRTGRAPGGAIVQVGVLAVKAANAARPYDSEIGALADALARAGFDRAVVANADGREPDTSAAPKGTVVDPAALPGSARQRQAVLAVMDGHGSVPEGRVDGGLLTADPAAPFGVRLDVGQVGDAFDAVWRDHSVVLVEASDLARADRYRQYSDTGARVRARRAALARSDELFGRLLDRVDLSRDVVMVVGPAHPSDRATLTPLAIRGPGFPAGLLRSATTRRAGFVQIQDIGPTVLAAAGVARPTSMEGRAAEVSESGGRAADRRDFIETADAAAQFRDGYVGWVFGVFVGAGSVVAIALLAALGFPAQRRIWVLARFLALSALGLIPAVFLARLLPLQDAGYVAYYVFLFGVAFVLAGLYLLAGRRRTIDSLLVAVLAVVALLTVDALRGAPLVLSSALGYSPVVAGRFAGFGNLTYAVYSTCALIGAVLLAHRIGGRRGVAVAAAILGLAIVIDGAPMWGSDVGGIVSMVPAYAVALLVLTGHRVRARTALVGAGAVAVVGSVATLVDLARPSDQQTHLGRLAERVLHGGFGEGWTVIQRKLDQNLSSLRDGSALTVMIVVIVTVAVLVHWHRARLVAVWAAVPEWRAGCLAFVVLAVLGFALNDSGLAVPAMMLVVFLSAWAHLLLTVALPTDSDAPPATRVLVGATS